MAGGRPSEPIRTFPRGLCDGDVFFVAFELPSGLVSSRLVKARYRSGLVSFHDSDGEPPYGAAVRWRRAEGDEVDLFEDCEREAELEATGRRVA